MNRTVQTEAGAAGAAIDVAAARLRSAVARWSVGDAPRPESYVWRSTTGDGVFELRPHDMLVVLDALDALRRQQQVDVVERDLPEVEGPHGPEGTFVVLDGPHGTYPGRRTETLWCADAADARGRAALAQREARQWEAVAARLDALADASANHDDVRA